ncbi:MFS transporter [Spirillospora sp. CA-294931]|uniref:MFS transporter n=1 Tax=Spirillospora sp. CA-294931 TaxID=3240042 RepID=UPI003D9259CB
MVTYAIKPELSRARGAVTLAFLVHGMLSAAWVARIPQIKERLELSDGELGLALLGAPVGLAVAVRLAGRTVGSRGSRATTIGAGVASALSLVPLGLAWNLPILVVSLAALGASLGLMDVAMNAQGVALEREYGRPLLSGLHGFYSIGTLVAALAGAAAAHLHVPVAAHFGVAAVVMVSLLLACRHRLLDPSVDAAPRPVDAVDRGPAVKAGRWTLVLLGVICLCSFVGEGAMADWSAVYLRETLDTGPGVAGLGYAGCAIAMAAGRLAGDRVVARFGAVRVLRVGSMIAGLGLALGLLAEHPAAAVAGFTLFGLGAAPVAPVTFSAAGNLPGVPAANGISRVTGVGYLGLLAGPPVIGFVAQGVGQTWALAVPAALAVMIVLFAGAARTAAP